MFPLLSTSRCNFISHLFSQKLHLEVLAYLNLKKNCFSLPCEISANIGRAKFQCENDHDWIVEFSFYFFRSWLFLYLWYTDIHICQKSSFFLFRYVNKDVSHPPNFTQILNIPYTYIPIFPNPPYCHLVLNQATETWKYVNLSFLTFLLKHFNSLQYFLAI